jgi:hypothetical protein
MSLFTWKLKKISNTLVNHPVTGWLTVIVVIAAIVYCFHYLLVMYWHYFTEFLYTPYNTSVIVDQNVSSSQNDEFLFLKMFNDMTDILLEFTILMMLLAILSFICKVVWRLFLDCNRMTRIDLNKRMK